jgi:hypothetical protein
LGDEEGDDGLLPEIEEASRIPAAARAFARQGSLSKRQYCGIFSFNRSKNKVMLEVEPNKIPERLGDADRCKGFWTNRVGGVRSQLQPGLRLILFFSSISSLLLIRSRDFDFTINRRHGDLGAGREDEGIMKVQFCVLYKVSPGY